MRLTHQLLAFGRRQALEPRIQDLTDLVHSNEQILRRLIRENLELALVGNGADAGEGRFRTILAGPVQPR
jgi:hypothetical protein